MSELTQQSGSLTRLASDLGQGCQKYVCTIPFLAAYVSDRMGLMTMELKEHVVIVKEHIE
jgi:hypothetical protein